ncbi:CoxG family protein [Novosphingobium mangrovi (ex Huang et al. 2023)]|uniref:Carbon monoxide dehydrogenase subunit G n=1 Tax=Novosphingobium mangrovi (ex Huang et al. 2023) TaxID=2976432 RepID=A0ABT2I2A9_9SPHN|nr:carbon monoxide dehydrogenase subunit G [Novosphingobium mangrovi (ex Huang et al. 2023)]MCT2398944.1 carbon monoxide dehydrogenase subunit G [Novosphingobium mangrovi (ex Huang et al. 2023)]
MQMTGEQRIAAPRQKVWEALNDPAVLAQCIPGCQSLDRDGADRFVAVAEVKIGPIGARFKGNVQLSDIDAPNGYTITGSGNGGIAGSARGGAKVRLSEAPGGGTLVSYDVEAEVGGRMAQLGGPIIDATAKNLAGKFFAKFGEVVSGGGAAPAAAAPVTEAEVVPVTVTVPTAVPAAAPAPLWGWVVALVLALTAGFTLGQMHVRGGGLLLVAVLLVVTAAAAFEAGRRGGRT